MNQSSRERALVGCLLTLALSTIACGSVRAAPVNAPARLSIASPYGGQAVAGVIPVAIAFDAGPSFGRVTAVSIWVDDNLCFSRGIVAGGQRGTDYLDLDTRRLANGQHVIKVVAYAGKQVVASDDCIVNVSNGGLDTISPLVSFRHLADGDVVSGNFDIDVHAADNDSVQVVSIFVNRWPVLIKSSAPYAINVDSARYQDQNGKATLKLEAWAYDRSNNLGKAKPITVHVDNQPNATPAKPDPAQPVAGGSPTTGRAMPETEVAMPGLAEGPAGMGASSEARGGVPESGRPMPSRAASPAGELVAPGLSGGQSTPTLTTQRDPMRMASAGGAAEPALSEARPVRVAAAPRTVAPEIVADGRGEIQVASAPRTAAPGTPSRRNEAGARPVATRLVVSLVPIRASGPAAGGAPAATQAAAKRSAPVGKPGEPLMFAWDPNSQPNENGRYAMRVFQGKTSPYDRERTHVVKQGETLDGIARAYKVTPRSIMVASGLRDGARLGTGMKLRVPGTFQVVLNDQQVAFDVAPRIENGMPIAPIRQIMEHSGGMMFWYPKTQTVRGINEAVEIELKIGNREATVNQQAVTLDRAPFIDRGRTMVPIRFVEEALDLKAEYDVRTGSIYLVKK